MNNEADIRSALPRHIGLIMDGNGRWAAAKERRVPTVIVPALAR